MGKTGASRRGNTGTSRTEENIDEVDDACVATFDDDEEAPPTELEDTLEDTLPSISITSTFCLITLIAFMRRRSYV